MRAVPCLSNFSLSYWRGSALAFPFGEGGCPNGQTEEVYRQYVFAETLVITQLFTAPLPPPSGGTLPKGEGFDLRDKLQFNDSKQAF